MLWAYQHRHLTHTIINSVRHTNFMEKIIEANMNETGVQVIFLSGLQPVSEYFSIETLKDMHIHPLDLLENPRHYAIDTAKRRLLPLFTPSEKGMNL